MAAYQAIYKWDFCPSAPQSGWTAKTTPGAGLFPLATNANAYGIPPNLAGEENAASESNYMSGFYWISNGALIDSCTLVGLTIGKNYICRTHLYSPSVLTGGAMPITMLNINGGNNYSVIVPSNAGRVIDIPFTATGTTATLNYATLYPEKYFSALEVLEETFLTPTNPTLAVNSFTEFTSIFQNALWSATAGVVSAGSNSYKRNFTAPSSPQTVTLKALKAPFTYNAGDYTLNTDTYELTKIADVTNTTVQVTGRLAAVGDYVDIIAPPKGYNLDFYDLADLYNFQEIRFYNNGIDISFWKKSNVYDGVLTTLTANVDKVRFQLITDPVTGTGKVLRVIKNPDGANTTLYTFTEKLIGVVRIEMYMGAGNSVPNGTVFKPPITSTCPYETTAISVVAPIAITSITRPTTSISLGDNFSPTVVTSGGSGMKSYVWKVAVPFGSYTTVSGATTAAPTIAASYFQNGVNTIQVEVTDSTGTVSTSVNIFVGQITGASSTDNVAESYSTNVPTPAWSKISGGGSIDSSTGVFTKPTTGAGSTVIKATNASNSEQYATKTVSYSEDATPPPNVTIGAATAMAGRNRIAFTTVTDPQSGTASYVFQRATATDFSDAVELMHSSTLSPFDDTTRADGVFYRYRVKAVNGVGGRSESWSVPITVQSWNAAPTITEISPIATAEIGVFMTEPISASGGDGALVISLNSGSSFPAGMGLVGNAYHGTRATPGIANFTLKVTDANGQSSTKTFAHNCLDTTPPNTVASLVATKVSNGEVTVASSGATDLSGGSLTYQNRRQLSYLDVAEYENLSAATKDFTDADFNDFAHETNVVYEQKGVDASSNVATTWKASNAVHIVPAMSAAIAMDEVFTVGESITAVSMTTGGSDEGHTFKWRMAGSAAVLGTDSSINLDALPPGDYELQLEETDAYGNVSTATHEFTVEAVHLTSTYSPSLNLTAPVTIQFTDTTVIAATETEWHFGDYMTSDQISPKHKYLAPGNYKIWRKAKVGGAWATEEYEIAIGGEPPEPLEDGIEFDEIEIPRDYLDGAKGGPTFLTSILGNPTGRQQRNISRYDFLNVFELEFNHGIEEFYDFYEFFITRWGGGVGFRCFDPLDHTFESEHIANVTNGNATYRLTKSYEKAGRKLIRRIVKPNTDLVLKLNGSVVNSSSYVVNHSTGEISFNSPGSLTTGQRLTVSGTFCFPAVFQVDNFDPTHYTTFAELTIRIVELLPAALGIYD